jgi:hypothetical protein
LIAGAFFEVEKRRSHAATAVRAALPAAFAALMHFERFIEEATGFFALELLLEDFGALGAFGAEPPPELLAPPELELLLDFCSPVVCVVESSFVERRNAFTL